MNAGRIALGAAAAVLIAGGGAVLLGNLIAPEVVERGYGAVKTAARSTVDKVAAQVFDAPPPSVLLETTGGTAELDEVCFTNRGFVVMPSYEREGVPPVAAAHNNCGGDVLLAWEEGQRVEIEGQGFNGLYEVVDVRYTSKVPATNDDLVGLGGDLALQTCFYGEDRMKFIGLALVN